MNSAKTSFRGTVMNAYLNVTRSAVLSVSFANTLM